MLETYAGSTAWILSGRKEASSNLRMKASLKVPITLSRVDCRLLRYDIHADEGEHVALSAQHLSPDETPQDRNATAPSDRGIEISASAS